jgi:N-acetylmuramoyl-L-alanine amidase
MRTFATLLLMTLIAAALPSAIPVPTEFDERWIPDRPRQDDSPYPNLPSDWESLPNSRYVVPDDRPLEGLRICIDAGHGGQCYGSANGYTAGTRGVATRLTESEVNFRTAHFLWDMLTQAGAEVVMTRTRPTRLTEPNTTARQELHVRPEIAEAEGCDYFLSIHHNAPREPDPELNYTSVYYFDTTLYNEEYNADPAYVNRHHDPEMNAERIAMARQLQNSLSRWLDLRVIDPPHEWWDHEFGHGVLTDPGEDQLLNDPMRSMQAARALFEGLLAHFERHPVQDWNERPPASPSEG